MLYIFNHAAHQKHQTPQLFVLSFLRQILEYRTFAAPGQELTELFNTYSEVGDYMPEQYNSQRDISSDYLPSLKRARAALQQELLRFGRVFVVVDALDEYRVGDSSAPKELVRELELLRASLLITSRNEVPFMRGTYERCTIVAAARDVETFVTRTMESKSIGDLLRQQDGLSDEIIRAIVKQTQGM